MCEVLGVSRAGYYKWQNRQPTTAVKANITLLDFLLATAKKEHGIPGYRKLWKAAVEQGFFCSRARVQRLLQSVSYRSRVAMKPGYIKPKPSMPTRPNLLNRVFLVEEPNTAWVSDITQIRCDEGWLYIAVILDLYSRKVIGWASGPVNNAELVKLALTKAWKARQPKGGDLLFHSDQGCQYRSELVVRWLARRKVTISMSRRGNCWDNACMESFFAQMKKEWFKPHGLQNRAETKIQTQLYIETYYNTVRRHGTLDGVSPITYENQ